jgi:hypothetical protein
VVIVPFFGTTLAMQTVGVDLSADTKHTRTVPLRAPNCDGPHRGLGIRHKESQVTREDGDVIGRNTIAANAFSEVSSMADCFVETGRHILFSFRRVGGNGWSAESVVRVQHWRAAVLSSYL